MKLLKTVLIMLICAIPIFAQNGDIVLKINGHKHSLDFSLKDQVQKTYTEVRDSLIEVYMADNPTFDGYKILNLKLGKKIESISYTRGRYDFTSLDEPPFFELDFDPDADSLVYISLEIPGNSTRLKGKIRYYNFWPFKWTSVYEFTARFHMCLTLHAKLKQDGLQISILPVSAEAVMKNIHCDGFIYESAAHILELFQPIVRRETLDKYLNNKEVIINLTDYNGDVVSGVSETAEMEAILKSVPYELSFDDMVKSSELRINLDFLHGYYNDLGQFSGNFTQSEPQSINNMEYAGFGYLHWGKFDHIKKDDPSLTRLERIDTLFQRMDDLGWNQFRFEAVWSDLVPEINDISGTLDASTITDTEVTNYINEIDQNGGWDNLDDLFTLMSQYQPNTLKKPVMVVGCGHINRPPQYNDGGTLKRIAPGTVRQKEGMNPNDYIGVPQNVYIYWLTKYVRAVVRRYADKIYYWQAENELNAARFTESFYDWWRAGSAWADDSENGFQTQVASAIYNAIKHEEIYVEGGNGDFEVVQAFHLFNAAKRLVEWKDYYDVAGLHLYPHTYHAYPLLSFLPGEFVWAARRILTAIDEPDKHVWITETGYPGMNNEPDPEDPTDNINHYSYARQMQYINEVMSSCAENGAHAFQWYLPEMPEAPGSGVELEQKNNYNGFWDISGYKKPSYQSAKNTFERIKSPTKNVSFTNKYQTENVGGYFNIKSIINGIPSGTNLNLNTGETYDVTTTSQELPRPGTADTVVMRQWSTSIDSFRLKKLTDFSKPYEPTAQEALFDKRTSLQLDMSIGSYDVTDHLPTIGILDPWLGTVSGERPEEPQTYLFDGADPYYEVFKNAEYDQQYPNNPYYLVHAPEIIALDSVNLAVFKEWNAIQNVQVYNPDSCKTPIRITSDDPIIEAEYFHDIKVQIGTIEYTETDWNGDLFLINAHKNLGSNDSIYAFEQWNIYQSDGQTIDNSRADFGYYGDGRTLSKVDVSFNNSQATLRPSYFPVSQIEDYILTLESVFDDEEFKSDDLFIGPGNNIELAKGFFIYAYHTQRMAYGPTVTILGKYNSPVYIQRNSASPDYSYFLYLFYDTPGYQPFDSVLCQIEYTHFSDFSYNGSGLPVIKFSLDEPTGWGGGDPVSHSQHVFYMKNCSFYNCDNALDIYAINCPGDISVINCTFYNTNIDLWAEFVENNKKTHFYNCIFSNTDLGTILSDYVEFHNCIFFNVPNQSNLVNFGSGNTITDPEFVNAAAGNFNLQWSSPGIDNGQSLYPDVRGHVSTHLDPDGTIPDIGAFHYVHLEGTLTSDVTIGGEVLVAENVTIPDTVTLTILPGAVIKLDDGVTINVYGKFMAVGTEEDSITFTSVYASPSTAQFWDRIKFFDSANDSSVFEYCNFKYGTYGIHTYKANISLYHCTIDSMLYYGTVIQEAVTMIKNNRFRKCKNGLYLYNCNNYGESEIFNNTFQHGAFSSSTYAVLLYRSSPKVYDNEIDNFFYGIYCTNYSSPELGWLGQTGNNYIHNTTRGLYAIVDCNPILGQAMCTTYGGHNAFVNNTYHLTAKFESTILAENNWWGSAPPNSNKFYTEYSTIDYTPYLSSGPLSKITAHTAGSGDESEFDTAFGSTTDSTLSEDEVMETYDPNWPILRRLVFAKNLIALGFPVNASAICNSVLKTYPDSSEAYFALDLLWQAGRGYTPQYEQFKAYLDSFACSEQEREVYEEAELLLDELNAEGDLAKLSNSYKKYRFESVASHALFNVFMFYLNEKEDLAAAAQILHTLESEYPNSIATEEARLLFESMSPEFDETDNIIPEDFKLLGNYPNPFNPETHIRFALPITSNVEITIVNLLGQKIRTIKADVLEPGIHELTWDSANDQGIKMSTGMYLYTFKAQTSDSKTKFRKSGKLLLLK